jgi:DNA modification methylase
MLVMLLLGDGFQPGRLVDHAGCIGVMKVQAESEGELYLNREDHNMQQYKQTLAQLLSEDLNFYNQTPKHALHNFHSFPAKFPPQLPHKFIMSLTNPGDAVLDPMMGSGTTVLEACLCQRRGIGFDIDPLSILIGQVKVAHFNLEKIEQTGIQVLNTVKRTLQENKAYFIEKYRERWDQTTRDFIDYWFASETQTELVPLMIEIEKIDDELIRNFFKIIFSGIIITKSGGVSLSFDLAHTRPHRAPIAISKRGEILFGKEFIASSSPRIKILTKNLRSPLSEFEKKFQQNLKNLKSSKPREMFAEIKFGKAQKLELPDSSINLIVTSPPYASNAIDYMRAHKFSLVWFGYSIRELSRMRNEYIGGDATQHIEFEKMPQSVCSRISKIAAQDKKKSLILHRYYSEMKQTLREMFRVLKPNTAAIVVVGSSIMRGIDTETATCLSEIGQELGFEVPKIGIRALDRNKRMLPAGTRLDLNSQIQQRMHQEYVIGFYKPEN